MFFKVIVLAGSLGAIGLTSTTQAGQGCLSASDPMLPGFVDKVQRNLSHPGMERIFASSGLKPGDRARIHAVASDSLCRVAVLTINRGLQVADTTPRRIHLISVGKVYWAVDTTVSKGSEFSTTYVIDGTLRKIETRLAM